jgi:hypothetical protein
MRLSVSRTGIAALFTAVAVTSAYAAHIPTHGAVVHLDLNPAGAIDVLPAFAGVPPVPVPVVGGPCGAFATGEFCNFVDGLVSFPEPFHWESEIVNVNAFPVAFNVVFFSPAGIVRGRLGLLPGAAFNIDIHVPDVPEVGPWRWTGFSFLPFPIGMDTSVTENPALQDLIACGSGCTFDPTITDNPDVTYRLEAVPEPGSAVLLAVGLTTCIFLRRRST